MPDTYLNESYQATTGIYNRYMPTAVVGIDCTFDGDAGWTCQRLEGYQNTTLQTVGATELQSPGAFLRNNNVDPNSIMSVSNQIRPRNNQQQGVLDRAFLCAGSAQFCQ